MRRDDGHVFLAGNEIAQAVFKAIVAERWFDRSPASEKEFAVFILRAYRDGITNLDRLLDYCTEVAKVQYSR